MPAGGYEVTVGGGLGRTPMVGRVVREFLPKENLLSYVEAIMRVYNLNGRRDNKYKARIKILIHETGFDSFVDAVESEFKAISLSENRDLAQIDPEVLYHIEQYFQQPDFMPDHKVGTLKNVLEWIRIFRLGLNRIWRNIVGPIIR